MCGIAGKIYFNSGFVTPIEIMNLGDTLTHRGPNDRGIFISDNQKLGFANRRLAVIDLSPKGHMPMQYKNRYIITYNGEIYNFKQERKILRKLGYRFQSESDTEVILALYDKYKTDCLSHLRGMFAFAIYDKKENIVFLARDRIGKKPLKYYFDGNVFIFASELKAILTQKEVERRVDDEAIFDYLTYGYTIPPKTGFSDINKLEAGNYMILDLKTGNLTKNTYWHPDYSKKLNLSEEEWSKAILHKLRESVKLRMISDVPIGAFLSGGIDSSTVVALMAQNSKNPVKTFTIGFKDKNLDESKYAENVARFYNTDHQNLIVEPENVETLPDIAKMYEEPFADASSIVTSMVCKMAKESVTVVLNGDGGDENFTGYETFRRVQRDYLFDTYFGFSKSYLCKFSKVLAEIIKNPYLTKINNYIEKSLLPFSWRYGTYIQYFSNTDKNCMYRNINKLPNSFQKIDSLFEKAGKVDLRDKALYFDMTSHLPEDLLVKVDIASMAIGLEARSPFLDQELIDLSCQIPFDLKYHKGEYKYILKKAIQGLVPAENIYRRKIGFTIPLDQWFEGSLNSYASSILLDKNSYVTQIFHKEHIKRMLLKHSKHNDFGPRLWSLLSLELWHKAYFD